QVAHARLQPDRPRHLGRGANHERPLRPALHLRHLWHGALLHVDRHRPVRVALETTRRAPPLSLHRLPVAARALRYRRSFLDAQHNYPAANRGLLGRCDCADRRAGVSVLEVERSQNISSGVVLCLSDTLRRRVEYIGNSGTPIFRVDKSVRQAQNFRPVAPLNPAKIKGFHPPKRRMSMPNITKISLMSALTVILVVMLCGSAAAQHITGTLPDGAAYVIDVPPLWNGTLLLYSHGYVAPGSPNPAEDVGDPITGGFMLAAGYALAGSSYATTGWAVQQAIPDQIATLGVFQTDVGTPTTTIAWGHSLGGMITAGLVQEYPSSFNAALPMCGVVGGGVGTWNEGLDAEFAFNTLVAGGALQVVDITNPSQNLTNAEEFLAAAQATAQGQARIALAAALADVPGWYDPASAEPPKKDYTDQQTNQFDWLANVDFPFVFAFRAELEARAGGNPSFNNGVD